MAKGCCHALYRMILHDVHVLDALNVCLFGWFRILKVISVWQKLPLYVHTRGKVPRAVAIKFSDIVLSVPRTGGKPRQIRMHLKRTCISDAFHNSEITYSGWKSFSRTNLAPTVMLIVKTVTQT